MLWLHVKVGESVYVGDSVVKLVDKDKHGITITIYGDTYDIDRGKSIEFPLFTLHAGNRPKGLRLGFETAADVKIRREKRETRLPTK